MRNPARQRLRLPRPGARNDKQRLQPVLNGGALLSVQIVKSLRIDSRHAPKLTCFAFVRNAGSVNLQITEACVAREYVIDGARITSLESFYDEISRLLIPNHKWGRNLDAYDDILSGGFGTPDEGFVLRWRNSAASRSNLGHDETIKHLEMKLQLCHPSNRDFVSRELADARTGKGPTIFDILVEITKDHGPRGEQAEDYVVLVLE
jgi:RNAse (barnase) inhibitor barstar